MKINDIYSGFLFGSSGSGGGGQAFIVNMLWNEETEKSYLDKTAREIAEAMQTNPVIIVDIADDYALSWPLVSGWAYQRDYTFRILYEDSVMKFVATEDDEYPVEE